MSDLFHEGLFDQHIAQVFGVMAAAGQHTFQVLTKRTGRLRGRLADRRFVEIVEGEWRRAYARAPTKPQSGTWRWPLPNVWIGVSIEDQASADERIPDLLATPAWLRFLSVEPLLEPVDLGVALRSVRDGNNVSNVGWVIVGGESGAGARVCEVRWIRAIVEQCRAAAVPVFCKQLGARPFVRGEEDLADDVHSALTCREQGFPRYPFVVPLKGKGNDPREWPEDLRVRQFPPVRP